MKMDKTIEEVLNVDGKVSLMMKYHYTMMFKDFLSSDGLKYKFTSLPSSSFKSTVRQR